MGELFSGEIPQTDRERFKEKNNEYNPTEIIIRWDHQLRSKKGLHVIFDLDENLFDTATHWVNYTNRFLRMYGNLTPDERKALPSPEEVFAEGGPSNYYYKHFPNIFPNFDSYEVLADELRHRYASNKRGPAMANVAEVWKRTEQHAHVLGALTARPDTIHVRNSTQSQLKNAGVMNQNGSPIDVLYKPDPVPLKDSSREKLNILSALANTDDVQGFVILIDDSISTAKAIQKYNKERGNKRPIIQIVNCEGSLTKPKIEKGEFTEDQDNGIFFMEEWSKLEEVLERIQQWTDNQPSL